MSAYGGTFRTCWGNLTMSALEGIVLQKSFWVDQRKFLGPLMHFALGDVRGHIISRKNDHGPAYRRYGPLQRQILIKIDFREIFGIVRFSSFATQSATNGLVHHSNSRSYSINRTEKAAECKIECGYCLE